jgi:hypothetical protein
MLETRLVVKKRPNSLLEFQQMFPEEDGFLYRPSVNLLRCGYDSGSVLSPYIALYERRRSMLGDDFPIHLKRKTSPWATD